MREKTIVEVKDGDRLVEIEITPMDAVRGERWLLRVGAAVGGALSVFKEGEKTTIRQFMDALGAVDIEKALPLWDELLSCCRIKGQAQSLNSETLAGKFDYPTTIMEIKIEAAKASFGFFLKDGASNFLAETPGSPSSEKSRAPRG